MRKSDKSRKKRVSSFASFQAHQKMLPLHIRVVACFSEKFRSPALLTRRSSLLPRRFILGTAGHIDHGKSSLVRALTGTDPDRLVEEKERGITIELGFAKLALKDVEFGVIDVPGHEKFVRAMVAGATGLDLVMLVVAADEGVMPQTREHLDICTLLGVKHGLVALTKTDLIDDEDWLELVKLDVQEALADTFLEEAEIVAVSSNDGTGFEELKRVLLQCAKQVQEKTRREQPRLPVDRVFEMKGFGPVVTGTLLSGRLRVEDQVTVLPERHSGRIRGLQVHGEAVDEALAGQRTALNIQGVGLRELHRGQVIVKGAVQTTTEFDAEVRLLSHLTGPLKHRASLLFHAGTVQIPCRLWLYTDSHMQAGESGFARILLEEPAVLLPGDHFILRGFQRFEGNGTTVGGGEVVDPFPPRRKRREAGLERLLRLTGEERDEALSLLIEEAGGHGIGQEALEQRLPGSWKETQKLLASLLSQGVVGQFDKAPPRYVHRSILDRLTQETLRRLEKYHEDFPLEEGISREELREFLGLGQDKLYPFLLRRMAQHHGVVTVEDRVRLASHQVELKAAEAAAESYLQHSYKEGGLTPPRVKELMEDLGLERKALKPVLQLLMRRDEIVKITDELYFARESIDGLRQQLVAFLQEHGEITPQQFKQMTGASRKFTIPLAEYFDQQHVTRRVENLRVLRKTN
jgi:selenocysteine-specific elongation factor